MTPSGNATLVNIRGNWVGGNPAEQHVLDSTLALEKELEQAVQDSMSAPNVAAKAAPKATPKAAPVAPARKPGASETKAEPPAGSAAAKSKVDQCLNGCGQDIDCREGCVIRGW